MRKLSADERKQIFLEMMDYFDKVCGENGIHYSLTGGTLLGAVRHKGFIPWDDDVDIFLARPEYNKLLTVFPDDARFVWDSREKTAGYEWAYGRLYDTRTILTDADGLPSEGRGLYIDVSPVDGLPDNPLLRKAHMKYMRFLYRGRRAVITNTESEDYYKKGKLAGRAKNALVRATGLEFWTSRMHRAMDRYPFDGGTYIGNFTSPKGDRELLHRTFFDSYIRMEFEGRSYEVAAGWEEYLTSIYGDYMQLPPEDQRVGDHYGDSTCLLEEGETRESVYRKRRRYVR